MTRATDEGTELLIFGVSMRQKVGDVFLLTLLTPIFFVMLGLLVAVPAAVVIYGAGLGADDTQRARMMMAAAAAGALPLSLLALRYQVCWSITLLPDHLRLGSHLLGRAVPYEQVRLIRAGEHGLGARRRGSQQTVPLLIELASRPRRCRIFLPAADANAALDALHQRSDAPALGIDGKERLPRDPERRAAGITRLARLYRAIGLPLVVIGVALLGLMLSVAIDNIRHGGFWSDLGEMLEVIAAAIGSLGAGLASLRKARRISHPNRTTRS